MSKQANILTELEQEARQVPKLKADFIKGVLCRKHADDYFQTEVKTGPTQSAKPGELQIIDALAIKRSWSNPCFTGYEVKVSRSDFLQDTKWPNYLNYCHQFYWACPSGLIRLDEVEDGCGLVWVNADGGWAVRKAARYRRIKIPENMLMYIIMSKLEPDRHPFYSTDREFLEAYVQDRKDGMALRWKVSQKLSKVMEEALEKVQQAEAKAMGLEKESALGIHAMRVLEQFGCAPRYWFGSAEIDDRALLERLQSSAPPQLLRALHQAADATQRALALVEPKKAQEEGGDAA